MDCSGNYGNHGCGGGWYNSAFSFVHDYGHQDYSAYPYTGQQGGCRYNAGSVVTKVTAIYNVQQYNPGALKNALNNGPVSVAVEAGNNLW